MTRFFIAIAAAALISPSARAQAFDSQQASAVIGKYCATCHNPKLQTAGLVLDPATLTNVPAGAERWEKVIRKLRANTMPPPGLPRPDPATYNALAGFLETELDRAAAAKPNPGKLPLLHRLSRTEYQNAVRDLLAVEALPKEMDYSLLLPPDNSNSGFDNIADLLFVSPTAMESYLSAAEKISRLAVGDPAAPPMVNIYRVPDEQPQNVRVDGLPFGTRGGLAVRSYFPADGEYRIKVTFVGRSAEPEQVELTVDGERAQLVASTARQAAKGAQKAAPNAAATKGTGTAKKDDDDDPDAAPGYGGGRRPIEFRVPVKAGPRLIGVAFIEKDEVRDEEVLRPRLRGAGAEIGVGVVTISGPYNAKGPGDTLSRKRIFVCRPAAAVRRRTLRAPHPLHAGAPRLPAASHCERCRNADAFLHCRQDGRRVRSGNSAGHPAPAGQPSVPVSDRARSGHGGAGNRASG